MWRFASMAHEGVRVLADQVGRLVARLVEAPESGQRLHDDPGALGRVGAFGRALVRLSRQLDGPQRLAVEQVAQRLDATTSPPRAAGVGLEAGVAGTVGGAGGAETPPACDEDRPTAGGPAGDSGACRCPLPSLGAARETRDARERTRPSQPRARARALSDRFALWMATARVRFYFRLGTSSRVTV